MLIVKINEFAEISGIRKVAIRYYEKMDLLPLNIRV
ncbi:MAG: MerR family DNA-binding transcriptional regulator [Solibacillus sp.]